MADVPLYWTDPENSEFVVSVKDCLKCESGYWAAIAERVVRPSGGGQAGDRGVLLAGEEEVEFKDTISHDGVVYLVTEAPIQQGTEAILRLDMEWRKSMMKNHTGEHLFVRALQNRVEGLELGSIWIDGKHGTVEVSSGALSPEDLFEAEADVQRIISDALTVDSSIVGAGEIDDSIRAREGVTSKHEKLRIVKIEGFDSSACSGIHVRNTKDLVAFKIIDYELTEGRATIEFLTGLDALSRMSVVYNEVLQRKREYPYEIEQIGSILDKAKSIREIHGETVRTLLETLERVTEYTTIGEYSLRSEYLPGVGVGQLRDLVKGIEMPNQSILLLFTPGEQPSIGKCNLILRTHNTPEDASWYIAKIVEELGGRGGGSQSIYTGGFAACPNPADLYERIIGRLSETLK